MEKKQVRKGSYLLDSLQKLTNNGDAYIAASELFARCKSENPMLREFKYKEDLEYLLSQRMLSKSGNDIYLSEILACELTTARAIAMMLERNQVQNMIPQEDIESCCIGLTSEQTLAVMNALTHKISLITGGPGTGKTTLIAALVQAVQKKDFMICSPTGKASRNLSDKTGLPASTIHSALLCTNWKEIKLLIVDEASMITLPLITKLLMKAEPSCRIVLLGDENQLQAVGCGNVIPDLKTAGVAYTHLNTNHRQEPEAKELIYNIMHYPKLCTCQDLSFGASFQLNPCEQSKLANLVTDYAADAYKENRNIQLLTPRRNGVELSAERLNEMIRTKVNPLLDFEHSICIQGKTYYNGDRVMITKNDWMKGICNGDIGILQISSPAEWSIALLNGERVLWSGIDPPPEMVLAYAITVHKAQGSEYEEIVMPIDESLSHMLDRNLLFTAISRAQKKVVLFGESKELTKALRRTKKERKSHLSNWIRVFSTVPKSA